jgi:uncharacterized protein
VPNPSADALARSTSDQNGRSKRNVIFVVKVSKLCNLRCRYCYEFSKLSNPGRISLDQLAKFFRGLDEYYRDLPHDVRIRFIWHGGEPLLVPPDYYWHAFELQRQIFSRSIEVRNSVQTNLTRLDEPRLRLLRDGFDTVGVSIDLFGDLRVDAAGAPRQDAILDNMDRLRHEGVPFGCITVLTRRNLDFVSNIYAFYESLGMDFRILPLFPGETSDQHNGYEITASETLRAYEEMIDLMFEREPIIRVEPLVTHIRAALLYLSRSVASHFYRRDEWERYFIVDTDGATYSYSSVYDSQQCYGNVFESPLRDLLASSGRRRSMEAAADRVREQCLECRYFGSCDGEPVAERLSEFKDMYESRKRECIVEKGVISYVVEKLRRAQFLDGDGTLVAL